MTASDNEQREHVADEGSGEEGEDGKGDGEDGVGRAMATRMKKRVARAMATATKRVRPTRVSDSDEGERRRRG